MSIEELSNLIEAVSKLVSVIVWPAVIVFVIVRFSSPLQKFFSTLGEFSLKAGGLEATAKRRQDEATAALVAASVARPDMQKTPASAAREAHEAAAVVADAVSAGAIRRASRATALWVDDEPENNIFERRSLEALGLRFVLAKTTDEALELLSNQSFSIIISDMNRPPDPRAGYTLLDQVRSTGNQIPFVIYTGSDAAEYNVKASNHGALGSTNRASELFSYVMKAIKDAG